MSGWTKVPPEVARACARTTDAKGRWVKRRRGKQHEPVFTSWRAGDPLRLDEKLVLAGLLAWLEYRATAAAKGWRKLASAPTWIATRFGEPQRNVERILRRLKDKGVIEVGLGRGATYRITATPGGDESPPPLADFTGADEDAPEKSATPGGDSGHGKSATPGGPKSATPGGDSPNLSSFCGVKNPSGGEAQRETTPTPKAKGPAKARSGSATAPTDAMERARKLLERGYRERYERATAMPGHEKGEPWMSASANQEAIRTVAAFCVGSGGELELVVDAVLDGYFARADLRASRWPWRYLAENPGRYLAAGRGCSPRGGRGSSDADSRGPRQLPHTETTKRVATVLAEVAIAGQPREQWAAIVETAQGEVHHAYRRLAESDGTPDAWVAWDALEQRAHAALADAAAEALLAAYQERWRATTGDAWQGPSDDDERALRAIVRWCSDGAGSPGEAARRAADIVRGGFADEWATEQHWPLAALAKNPSRYHDAGRRARVDEKRFTRERSAAEARNRETFRKLDEMHATPPAPAPPEALEMLAKLREERAKEAAS